MGLEVRLMGTRGSLPTPHQPAQIEKLIQNSIEGFLQAGYGRGSEVKSYLEDLPRARLGGFGGNTSSVQVRSDGHSIIIDGGSGIRLTGYELLAGPCGKGKGTVDLLFTHFHWDHLIGLPFFVPFFIPGNTINVYSVQPDLENVFKILFKKPFFPVSLEQLGSTINYHQLEPRQTKQFGDMKVTPYELDHPDPCWGYKIEQGGKVYSHCVDTEATRVNREQLGPDLPLYQNIDVMLFDAQYTLMETIEKVNWGHAAASIGLDIAMREGIKKVIFVHHEPASNDEKIASAEDEARRYYASQLKAAEKSGEKLFQVDWCFGYDGMVIKI